MTDPFASARQSLHGLRYLLVTPVAFYRDVAGAIWLDALWLHDLRAHLTYLSDVTVLAPCLPYRDDLGLVLVDIAQYQGLGFKPMPAPVSFARAMLALPQTALAMLRALRGSDVVHSGVAGWPIPPGLLANVMAALLRKPLVIVIESAFWRVADPATASRKARLRAGITEAFARWSVRRAKLAIFTHQSYRDSLSGGSTARLLVTNASWIAAGDILPQPEAEQVWAGKPDRPRFVFAGRFTADKGLRVLLNALELLDTQGIPLEVDIVGSGDLRQDCTELAARLRHVRLGLPDPTAYGAAFFALLRRYHALVVPSLSDEQPRVIFDAYAQAVPVLASDTAGHRDVVQDGGSGWLFAPGDPQALADCLKRALDRRADLAAMGLAALGQAQAQTHLSMHLTRANVLAGIFGAQAGATFTDDLQLADRK